MKGRTRPDGHDFPPKLRQHVDNINGLSALLSDMDQAASLVDEFIEITRKIEQQYPGDIDVSLNVEHPTVDVLVNEYGVSRPIARKIAGGGIGVD